MADGTAAAAAAAACETYGCADNADHQGHEQTDVSCQTAYPISARGRFSAGSAMSFTIATIIITEWRQTVHMSPTRVLLLLNKMIEVTEPV